MAKKVNNLPIMPFMLIRSVSLTDAIWEQTTAPVLWYGRRLPIGIKFKGFTTRDHGYVMLEASFEGHRFYKM